MRVTIWIFTLLLLITLTFSGGPGTATGKDVYVPLKRFSQVLDLIEENYVREVTREDLLDGAIKGMLQQLDPHSTFMDKDEFKDMQISTSGEFGGVGIEITLKNNRLTVIAPIEDTPGFKAGLQAGDIILEIDGESTQDITLLDAVKKIRGPKGSTVELTILHKDEGTPEKVSIKRDTIPIKSVKNEELEKGQIYIRLTRFNENTTDEMRKVLGEYSKKSGGLKGVILDMRNNPGGLLDQAVSVADTFLSKGNIVYIQGRDEKTRKDFNAKISPSDVKVPMVVLINAGSASASEIVAGALQDHKRALLLGERTFGKATVQTIIPLADGSGVKLTTALYYTPNGRSIQAEGIDPDLNIPFEPSQVKDVDLSVHSVMREKDLSGHLETNNHKAQKQEKNKKAQEMLQRDNQLRLALQLVKQLPNLKLIK